MHFIMIHKIIFVFIILWTILIRNESAYYSYEDISSFYPIYFSFVSKEYLKLSCRI